LRFVGLWGFHYKRLGSGSITVSGHYGKLGDRSVSLFQGELQGRPEKALQAVKSVKNTEFFPRTCKFNYNPLSGMTPSRDFPTRISGKKILEFGAIPTGQKTGGKAD